MRLLRSPRVVEARSRPVFGRAVVHADKCAEFLDSGEPFGEDELGDWETLKGIARSIKDNQPYGEKAEYEIYPLLDVLDANPGIFAAAPQSPGLDTLKNMVRHLKHDGFCVDEGVTADDIPGNWYRGAAL